jgi:hypothetical protein
MLSNPSLILPDYFFFLPWHNLLLSFSKSIKTKKCTNRADNSQFCNNLSYFDIEQHAYSYIKAV